MNRSSKENLVVSVTSAFQMQVREPYLIFRMEKEANVSGNNSGSNDSNENVQKIRGIWFHNSEEREAISNLLGRIVKAVATSSVEEEVQKPAAQQPKQKMSHSEATATLLSTLNINRSDDGNDSKNEPSVNSKRQLQQQQPSQLNNDDQEGEKQLLQNLELDKKSLQLSLMSLLQDERFLDLIHAQYIKVVRARKNNSE